MTGSLDRSGPPAPGAAPEFHAPAFRRERLPSGLGLVLAPRDGVPLVEAWLLVPAGGELNPDGRSGLAALAATLLDEGTARRTGLELATALERLGATLGTGSDWDATRIEASALAEHLDALIDTVSEVALTPSFPDAEVERLRRQTLAEIARRPDHPARLADRGLAAALYPGTPFAELLQGSAEDVAAIRRDEIVDFHEARYGPQGSHLLVAGSFDSDRVRRLASDRFADWRSRPVAERPGPPPPAERTRGVTVIDLPRAPQTELRIGHVGVPRTHPDRTRLGVLNALLGGKFTSRLNLNLRERHGFTYGVSSRFIDRRSAGPFVVATSIASGVAGAATAEVLAELGRLREDPVGDDELAETCSYLRGVYPYTFQTISGHLSRLADLALHELPDDHFEAALAEIEATTADDLLDLAREHLRPEQAAIVVAGPAAELAPQLERFGPVEVVAPE